MTFAVAPDNPFFNVVHIRGHTDGTFLDWIYCFVRKIFPGSARPVFTLSVLDMIVVILH